MHPLTKAAKRNFATMLRAADAKQLALISGIDVATGEARSVICAVQLVDGEYVITPFGHLSNGNPYEEYSIDIDSADNATA